MDSRIAPGIPKMIDYWVSVDEIIDVVCTQINNKRVTREAVKSPSREKPLPFARAMSVMMAREFIPMYMATHEDIMSYFNRDRSTYYTTKKVWENTWMRYPAEKNLSQVVHKIIEMKIRERRDHAKLSENQEK